MEIAELMGNQLGAAFPQLRESLSAGMFFPCEQVCFMVEAPAVIHVDENMNAHRLDEAAIRYADGWQLYCLRNVLVDERIACGQFTWTEIEQERNVERRRVLIERFGFERYLKESGATPIQQDKFGTLYRKEVPGDEPIVMVEVTNATAEKDGSYKTYFLRVPPDTRTAREAVSWTFSMRPADYHPKKET